MTHRHRLFLDMDGVLADFEAGYAAMTGVETSKQLDNVDWSLVRATPHFFRDLPPMPGFQDLWNFARAFRPVVLTGIPDSMDHEAFVSKREWVLKNMGPEVPVIGCKSADKCLSGRPGDVLVDDWEKYKHKWIEMGGVWITHVSAEDTIPRLVELACQGKI